MENKMTEWQISIESLPSYLTVVGHYDKVANTVRVEIKSEIHVNPSVMLPDQWSLEFTRLRNDEFLGEILAYAIKAYGLTLMPTKYV